MTRNMSRCTWLKHVDNAIRQARVESARTLIYEKGASMKSNGMKFYMDPYSEVPTHVSCDSHLILVHRSILIYKTSEFILGTLLKARISISSVICTWLSSQVWVGHFQSYIYSIIAINICYGPKHYPYTGLKVLSSKNYGICLTPCPDIKDTHIWVQHNSKICFKCVCNEKIGSLWFWGNSTDASMCNTAMGIFLHAWLDYIPQCLIPAFEHLMGQTYNLYMLDLLFKLCTFHFLAKLCLHTESTLHDLEVSTAQLGDEIQCFEAGICQVYRTTGLPSETSAQGRRTAALAPTRVSNLQPASTQCMQQDPKQQSLICQCTSFMHLVIM